MEQFHQVQDQLREPYRQLQAAIPEVSAAYGALHDAAMAEGALSAKVKELIASGHLHHAANATGVSSRTPVAPCARAPPARKWSR